MNIFELAIVSYSHSDFQLDRKSSYMKNGFSLNVSLVVTASSVKQKRNQT